MAPHWGRSRSRATLTRRLDDLWFVGPCLLGHDLRPIDDAAVTKRVRLHGVFVATTFAHTVHRRHPQFLAAHDTRGNIHPLSPPTAAVSFLFPLTKVCIICVIHLWLVQFSRDSLTFSVQPVDVNSNSGENMVIQSRRFDVSAGITRVTSRASHISPTTPPFSVSPWSA